MDEIILRIFPNIITASLQQHFNLLGTGLGLLSASYIAGYGLGQIPAGILIDRFGLRIVPQAYIIASLCLAVFIGCDQFIAACACRFVMGLFTAFAFLGCVKIIFSSFSLKNHALFIGLTATIGALGGIICNSGLNIIAHLLTWHWMLWAVFSCSLINALLLWYFIGYIPFEPNRLKTRWIKSLNVIFKNRRNWTIGLCAALIYLPFALFNDLWGQPFFQVVAHFNVIQSGWLISAVWGGWIIGSTLLGLLNRYYFSIPKLVFCCLLLQLIDLTCLKIWPAPWAYSGLLVFSLILGFSAASMNLCYAWGGQINPKTASASTTAFINTLVTVVVLGALPGMGRLLDWLNHSQKARRSS